MTAYTQSLSGNLTFQANQLYPDTLLLPGTLLYPGSTGGEILTFLLTRVLPASGLSFSGSVASQHHNITLNSVLQPAAALAKATQRALAGSLGAAGGFSASKSGAAFAKALFASLHAAGSLQAGIVVVEEGGGGFGVPMPDDHFQRYKPTLRRQKMRV